MAYKWHNSGAKLPLPAATYTPKLSWLQLMDPGWTAHPFPSRIILRMTPPLVQITNSSTIAYRKQVGYGKSTPHLKEEKPLWCNLCATALPWLLIRLKLSCAWDHAPFILSPPSWVSPPVKDACSEEHPSQWTLCRWLPFSGPCSLFTVFIAYIRRNKYLEQISHYVWEIRTESGLKTKLGVPESKGTSCTLAMQMKRLSYSLSP